MPRLHIWLILLCVLITVVAEAQQPEQKLEEKELIELRPVATNSPHPITLQDIVTLREIRELHISPDGNRIAFVVKQAFIDSNNYRSALYIMDARTNSAPAKLLEQSSLGGIRWTPDGKFITYVATKDGSSQVWKINPGGGTPETLMPRDTRLFQFEEWSPDVFAYEWSPDGTKIAFISSEPITEEEKKNAAAQGILYHDGLDFLNITEKSWIKKPLQLWIYDVQTKRREKVWEHIASVGGIEYTQPIDAILWAPSGRKIAVGYRPTNDPTDSMTRAVGVYSLDARKFAPVVTAEGYKFGVSWSPDDTALAFASQDMQGAPPKSMMSRAFSLQIQATNDREPKVLVPALDTLSMRTWWSKTGDRVIFEGDDRSTSALYEVSVKDKKVRKITQGADHISECSLSVDHSKAACIRQNTMTPPEIALVDLRSGVSQTVTDLNPEYKNVVLGKVTELHWKNKYGDETNGFLIKPVGFKEGARYPFLVTLYGFTGKFISQAQWISSYPAQAFAASGFVVLLVNYPHHPAYHYGNFEEASVAEAYSPLASIEKAVDIVTAMGLIDPQRKGIMGWSYGSFLTDFTISHSDIFQVASSGDGGRENPSRYWMNTGDYQYFDEAIYGGSPFGKSAEYYRQLAPALNAGRVRAPVLMQYAQRIWGLEFYTAVRKQGGHAELVFYPDEDHIFFQPKHRISSMQRNLDWFGFWLQEHEDPDPSKSEDYVRWRQMRDEMKHSAVAGNPSLPSR